MTFIDTINHCEGCKRRQSLIEELEKSFDQCRDAYTEAEEKLRQRSSAWDKRIVLEEIDAIKKQNLILRQALEEISRIGHPYGQTKAVADKTLERLKSGMK